MRAAGSLPRVDHSGGGTWVSGGGTCHGWRAPPWQQRRSPRSLGVRRPAGLGEHRRDRHRLRDAAGDDSTVEIPVGGTVDFSYPVGQRAATTSSSTTLQPTSCKQTAGDDWGAVPPLPWYMQGPGWAGTCTFTKAGTYEFHSGLNYADARHGRRRDADADADAPTPDGRRPRRPRRRRPRRRGSTAHDDASPTRNWFQDASSRQRHRLERDGQGRRAGHVRASRPGRARTTSRSRTRPKPALCPQTKVANAVPFLDTDNAPPMPGFAQPVGWEGNCTLRRARHVHVRLLDASRR